LIKKLPTCEVCGKSLDNPNHPSHIRSKTHQSALKGQGKIVSIKPKEDIKLKFEEIEKSFLKERIYNFIYQKHEDLKVSEVILYFQKFFPKEKVNSLLMELYFENLIDFKPKIPSEIEKILIILNKEINLKFPLSFKIDELEKITKKRYLDFDKIINYLKTNPEFIDFSPISIGKSSDLIVFKYIWKLNSLIWSVG